MPRQKLVHNEIDVREYMSAAGQPSAEVLDCLDILLDRGAAVAPAP